MTKIISSVPYQLELPTQWKIHNVFHIEKLKRFHRSTEFERLVLPPPPILSEGGTLEYEVKAIIREKDKGARKRYLVAWKGHPLHEATWEPEENLTHCGDLLSEFLVRRQQQKSLSKRGALRRK